MDVQISEQDLLLTVSLHERSSLLHTLLPGLDLRRAARSAADFAAGLAHAEGSLAGEPGVANEGRWSDRALAGLGARLGLTLEKLVPESVAYYHRGRFLASWFATVLPLGLQGRPGRRMVTGVIRPHLWRVLAAASQTLARALPAAVQALADRTRALPRRRTPERARSARGSEESRRMVGCIMTAIPLGLRAAFWRQQRS